MLNQLIKWKMAKLWKVMISIMDWIIKSSLLVILILDFRLQQLAKPLTASTTWSNGVSLTNPLPKMKRTNSKTQLSELTLEQLSSLVTHQTWQVVVCVNTLDICVNIQWSLVSLQPVEVLKKISWSFWPTITLALSIWKVKISETKVWTELVT